MGIDSRSRDRTHCTGAIGMTIKGVGALGAGGGGAGALAAGGLRQAATGPAGQSRRFGYPGAALPSYLKPVSIDRGGPAARAAAGPEQDRLPGRRTRHREFGETVTFVTAPGCRDLIVEAVKRAMEERGVKVNVVPEYEMVGVSKEDALEFRPDPPQSYTSEQGYMEAATWVEANFPDPDAIKDLAEGAPSGSLRQAVSADPRAVARSCARCSRR